MEGGALLRRAAARAVLFVRRTETVFSLMSAASGRSAIYAYHDIVDFVGKDTDCKFVHSCSYKGCGQAHSASTHMQGQSYNHTR